MPLSVRQFIYGGILESFFNMGESCGFVKKTDGTRPGAVRFFENRRS